MRHRLRLHYWVNGMLNFDDRWFESFADALEAGKASDAHHAKIYSETGTLLHWVTLPRPTDSSNSYA